MKEQDTVLARIADLASTPTAELKELWKSLFDSPPPRYNRRFLLDRLGYRLQELQFGGLKPTTVAHLKALGEKLDGGHVAVRRQRADHRPIAGTKLIREYQGVPHHVTVRQHDFEWEGRPYTSLSAIARAISGIHWNGWTFFGLKNRRTGK